MKTFYTGILILTTCFPYIYGQNVVEAKYAPVDPIIDGLEDHVYTQTDSGYINYPGNPNYGDLYYPDLELKFKPVWNEGKLFFLFRHQDDILVSGYTDDELTIPDDQIADGLENRDATALYLYLSSDSTRFNETIEPDSLTFWIRWTWKSNEVEARLTDGTIVHSFDDFFAECVQINKGPFWYAEISIDYNELIKSAGLSGLNTSDSVTQIGFDLEVDENDKEHGDAPYSIQTRAFWGKNLWQDAEEKPSEWGSLELIRDTLDPTGIIAPDLLTGIQVYPNPAKDYIRVSSEISQLAQVRIIDYSGRIILSEAVFKQSLIIPVENLESGYYIIQVIADDNRFYSQPLIKY